MKTSITDICSIIRPVFEKYGIKKASIFGSYALNKQTDQSDIDILIQPTEEMSLLDFAGVKLDLEDTLKLKVDLLSYDGISPYLKDKILSEQKVIYEA